MDEWAEDVREAYLRALGVIRASNNMRADSEFRLVAIGKRTARESYLLVQSEGDTEPGTTELRRRLMVWRDEMGDRVR